MSALLVILGSSLFTSLIAFHIHNENKLSKRIVKAGYYVQELLDQNEIKHIDVEKKFETSSLTTQIRVMEYYLHALDNSYKDFGMKKSVFQRISKIESVLMEYGYQNELSLI
ncbi:hypothetical protein [Ancylomarina longa]|uniref:Uncharacterized protein n=1 Tax=Ancylomarina longa TaxID=2487017 RepID=A0A434AGK3_9BACT|nr:hypothetical protein [Ancylomarina longa]RUT73525.1 hypothetical protein DLK05_13070 [Ancylomarina longa]